MEHRYSVLRNHLDDLGYQQQLAVDTVPLVERLLADLVKTTESLFHYKNIAQSAIEERDQLQLGAEPYKCDNAKLVKECNDLHLAFLQFREQTDKLHRDLKHQIHTLERENEEINRCIEQSTDKTSRVSTRRKTISSKSSIRHSASSVDTTKSKVDKVKDTKSAMYCNDEQISLLHREMKKLKIDLLKQNDLCECLKNKLNNREKEIQRLSDLLEGGRPLNALNKDCCYKDMNTRMCTLSEENTKLNKDKKDLEIQLAEAISKQHEAMKRALQLADRNKELERELRDIDQMALAVEEECNSTLKHNVNKVSKFQDELDSHKLKVQKLEREIVDLKRSKQTLELDFGTIKEEKDNLRKILENALDDKKRMTDRINQFTRIEHDLNIEVDRLMQTCTLQKRKISELEIQMVSNKFENKSKSTMEADKHQKKSSPDRSGKCNCCEKCKKMKKSRINESPTVASKDISQKDNSMIEKIKTERNHFQQECKRLRDELNTKKPAASPKMSDSIKRELKEKEEKIIKLEKEIQDLTRDKHNLISQLESMQEVNKWGEDIGSSSLKTALSRVEKERDLARGDVKRLEEERDSLRKRLKAATENHVSERDRLQKLMTDSEEKLRKLESERREMMTVQGSRRATINNLEEQIETLTTQLRTTRSELEHIHTLYSQIKILQEQTDRALADTQGQLTQVEIEYAHAQERIRELEKDRSELDKELSILKNDLFVLKGNIGKIDSERDNLLIEVDNKTERIASLEQELQSKENKLMSLETILAELRQQLSLYTDDAATKDYLLKSSSTELASMKRDFDDAIRSKAIALQENRRLQEDLAKVSLEWRNTNSELERAKREIEDLKTQLQQYVFEVKRAEDHISKKENERAEMLDQFRSLSQEATLLETSNHSLETKQIETKSQLTTALDHIQDLESKVEQQETMNKDYEKQISQLTSQIAAMETQLRQHAGINNKTESDLAAVKCLCVKLDEQKDVLIQEMQEKDNYRSHLEREKDRLKVEINKLRDTLNRDGSNIGSLENLLAASRQETVEQRLINQELQSEIQRLKNLVEELQAKLTITSQQLDVFQEKSLDYSQQLKQLRREIANERFRAHSGDLSSRYPSL